MYFLNDLFKNAIHSVREMTKSYKNNLVENALLHKPTRTINTNLLKVEILPILYRKTAEFPEEVWVMTYI